MTDKVHAAQLALEVCYTFVPRSEPKPSKNVDDKEEDHDNAS